MHRGFARSAIMVLVGLVLTMFFAPAAHAATAIDQAKAQAQKLQSQINNLNDLMKVTGAHYNDALAALETVKARISENERQLAGAEFQVTTARAYLAQRVVASYKAPPLQTIDFLMSAHSFADLVSAVDLLSRLEQQDAATIAQLVSNQNDIAQRQAQLDADRAQADTLVAKIAQEQAQLQAAVQDRQILLQHAQAKVKQLIKQMEAARLAAARRAAAAAAAAAAQRWGALPGSGAYTPISWAQAFLTGAHMPITTANVRAIVSWEMAEGGHWYNSARYNPLNTTMPEPGATDMNWVGVKAYTSWSQGLTATIATLFNGNYAGVIAALRRGDNAQAVADAVAASPWGTQPFTVA